MRSFSASFGISFATAADADAGINPTLYVPMNMKREMVGRNEEKEGRKHRS